MNLKVGWVLKNILYLVAKKLDLMLAPSVSPALELLTEKQCITDH